MTYLSSKKRRNSLLAKKKSFIESATGVNFTNVLRATFAHTDPKSVKIHW
jgi:hypothetical protein